jgi:hypothetical protein
MSLFGSVVRRESGYFACVSQWINRTGQVGVALAVACSDLSAH